MIKVDSENLVAVDYNRQTHVMSATFHKSTHIYHYYDVPEEVFRAMLNSGDVGRYFSNNIRGKYRYD